MKRYKALLHDILVEIRRTHNRYLSILCIVLLGVGFFAGIKSTCPDMKETAQQYFEDQNLMDMHLNELIAMFKGGHTRLSTVCYIIPPIPEVIPVKLPLLSYLRAADLSSDRGGLLACQSFAAAARCILWDAGIPMCEMAGKSEEEMIRLTQDYIASVKAVSPELLGKVATSWKKWNMESMPHVYRLEQLLSWYCGGYHEVVSKWKQDGEGRSAYD